MSRAPSSPPAIATERLGGSKQCFEKAGSADENELERCHGILSVSEDNL